MWNVPRGTFGSLKSETRSQKRGRGKARFIFCVRAGCSTWNIQEAGMGNQKSEMRGKQGIGVTLSIGASDFRLLTSGFRMFHVEHFDKKFIS